MLRDLTKDPRQINVAEAQAIIDAANGALVRRASVPFALHYARKQLSAAIADVQEMWGCPTALLRRREAEFMAEMQQLPAAMFGSTQTARTIGTAIAVRGLPAVDRFMRESDHWRSMPAWELDTLNDRELARLRHEDRAAEELVPAGQG